jgi:hypothetical protein
MVTPEQIAPHRHWCRADAIKYVLYGGRPPKKEIPEELRQVAELHSQFLRLEVFYSLIYVVIEGYRELSFQYEKVEVLLEQADYVDRLRRFRNAVFHYQRDPINLKLIDFLDAKDSEKWTKISIALSNNSFLIRSPLENS